jgi:pimeloyl-ACP methyl ester carboxylesterase
MKSCNPVKSFVKDTTYLVKQTLRGDKLPRRVNFACCPHPVLLIQGFSLTRRAMLILERRLRKDGYDVFSFNTGSIFTTIKTGNIKTKAQIIADKIEHLYRKYPNMGPLTIIGHSEGGIVGRYYVQFLGGDKYVKNLITLASPHQGSWLAFAGGFLPISMLARDVVQMMPGSCFLRSLRKNRFPRNINFYSFYSNTDKICPHPSCIALDKKGNCVAKHIEFDGIGHNEFLFRKDVYQKIRSILMQ